MFWTPFALEGLRQYQRTTIGQQEDISKVLTSGSTYQNQVTILGQQEPAPKAGSTYQHHVSFCSKEFPPQMNFSDYNVNIYNGSHPVNDCICPSSHLLEITNSQTCVGLNCSFVAIYMCKMFPLIN